MDTSINTGGEGAGRAQGIPVKPDSKLNLNLEEEEKRYTKHQKGPSYVVICERCGFRHICEEKHYHKGCHIRHRWRKFKETATLLTIVVGICFFVALLFTYITGNLPTIIERVISKNIEKALRRTTAELKERKFTPEILKNIDAEKLTEEALRNLGGWEGDRGEKQLPDEYKIPEGDQEHRH